jgi:hypothetical protein
MAPGAHGAARSLARDAEGSCDGCIGENGDRRVMPFAAPVSRSRLGRRKETSRNAPSPPAVQRA